MTLEERIQLLINATNELAQLANHRGECENNSGKLRNNAAVYFSQAVTLEDVSEKLTEALALSKYKVS